MKKSGLLIIGLMVMSSIMLLGMTIPAQAQTPEEVVISAELFANRYDKESVNLEKNTTYTITFVNGAEGVMHNLWIDVNGDVSSSNADKGEAPDILVGAPNNSANATGGPNQRWSVNWTTPDKDIDITYYCGTSGHFAEGMKGTFIIGAGSPKKAPGFGLALTVASIVAFAAVSTVARRAKKPQL